MKVIGLFLLILSSACASTPQFDHNKIRPWNNSLKAEYPQEKSIIAHYKKNEFELFYLAGRHTNIMGEDTLNLVETLFQKYRFNILIIDSIPYSSGESPKWFLEEAKKGKSQKFIKGGESSLAVIYADEKKIPFFAGEPDHQDIYKGLQSKGYSDEDIIGFYTARQIPQWVRENENKKGLFERKIPPFALSYCKIFSIASCPSLPQILNWYKSRLGHDLSPDVSNEEFAPYSDGTLFTQKMSAEVGFIRDHFTLSIIQQMIQKYKRVAVVYGASHFLTLRKSFDANLGEPEYIEDRK